MSLAIDKITHYVLWTTIIVAHCFTSIALLHAQCSPPSDPYCGLGVQGYVRAESECTDGGGTWDASLPCDCDYNTPPNTPVIIDVAANGIRLTSAAAGVTFTFAKPIQVAWTLPDADDAFLALDRNNNGRIDDATELFGSYTAQPLVKNRNGFAALAEFDRPENGGNDDDIIDAHDRIYASLLLWRDSNHNGISEPGELSSLAQSKIASIDLSYREFRRRDEFRNYFRYRARINDSYDKPTTPWAYDVILSTLQTRAGGNAGRTDANVAMLRSPGCPAVSSPKSRAPLPLTKAEPAPKSR